eukprot:scaffold59136_cov59-Phaeocystis_antarctica.AAC.2
MDVIGVDVDVGLVWMTSETTTPVMHSPARPMPSARRRRWVATSVDMCRAAAAVAMPCLLCRTYLRRRATCPEKGHYCTCAARGTYGTVHRRTVAPQAATAWPRRVGKG